MSTVSEGAKKSGAYAVVVAARVLLLLAAVGLAAAGFSLAFRGESSSRAVAVPHACPMHPEVTAQGPGECPVCKMALEPVAASGSARAAAPKGPQHAYGCPMHPQVGADAPGECPICKMALEPTKAAAPVASTPPAPSKAAYVCPMHPEVGSAAPGRCPECKMALEPAAPAPAAAAPGLGTTPLYGCPTHTEIAVDAPGQCPMCSATLKLLDARERAAAASRVIPASNANPVTGVTWLPESFPPSQPGAPSHRLLTAPVKRRAFVNGVRASAWLETPERVAALLYRDELVGLTPGEPGKFFLPPASRDAIEVRLSDEPPSRWDASTSLVRFVIDAEKAGVKVGDVGWLELPDKSRELLVFPESALLRSAEGPYVVVPGAGGHVAQKRPVEIGRILKGHVVVLSGLREGEQLIVSNAFFLDAERRLKSPEPVAGGAP